MFPAKGSERKPAFFPAFAQKVIRQVISLALEIFIQEMHMDGCYLEVAAYHELDRRPRVESVMHGFQHLDTCVLRSLCPLARVEIIHF